MYIDDFDWLEDHENNNTTYIGGTFPLTVQPC